MRKLLPGAVREGTMGPSQFFVSVQSRPCNSSAAHCTALNMRPPPPRPPSSRIKWVSLALLLCVGDAFGLARM